MSNITKTLVNCGSHGRKQNFSRTGGAANRDGFLAEPSASHFKLAVEAGLAKQDP